MYGIGISFPMKPTKEDIKKLKRELAHDMLEVMKGGKAKSEPTAKRADKNKAEPTSDKT